MLKRTEIIMDERNNSYVFGVDYHDKVQQEATTLISTMRGELDAKFRAEQQNLLTRMNCTKLQTREIIKGIGRAAREYGQKISEDKDRELNTIKKKLKRKHKQELRKAMKQTVDTGKSQESSENTSHKESAYVERFWRVVVCDNIPVCGACCRTSAKLSLCGACGIVWYCDEICQEKDWEKHQNICPGSSSEDESENALDN